MLRSTFGKLALVFLLSINFSYGQSSSHNGTTSTAYAIPTNSNLEISGDITLEAWLRPNAAQSNIGNVLMKGNYGYSFGVMNDGTIAFWQTNSQNSGPESTASIVQDGTTWTHVAVVNEGGVGTTFYINGVAVGSNATGGSFQVRTGDLYIGRQGACNCNFFNGLIDELRVWNDVRTAGEIATNYDKSVANDEQGLAAYYRLNEGSGTTILDEVTATSYTPSVNPITWSSEDANVSGINSSLTFDGVDDYVDIGTGIRSDLTGTSNVTVEAWVYRTATKTFHTIFSNYNSQLQTLLRLDDSNIRFWINNGAFQHATSTSDVPLNTWTHVAGTWDGSTIRVYLNGVLDGSTAVSGTLVSNGGNYRIGGEVTNEWFQGQIDEVRVWNTTRSDSEILNFKDEEIDPATPGLLAYYSMNEGSGTTLTDLGPNLNNGTFAAGAGAPVWNTTGPSLSGASSLPCDDPIITEIVTDNTSCSAGNGALTVLPSTAGGEPAGNYTVSIYLTSDVTMTPIVSGINVDNVTGLTATGLVPDVYTAEVTNNDTGCSTTQAYAVNDNTSLPGIDAGSIIITFESTGGATDGALDATGTGTGGSGSYTYNWYSDAGLTTLISSESSISALAAGTYYLEVVDDVSACISSSQPFDVLVAPQNALDLDGTNDYIDFGNDASLNLTTSFTVEQWIYPISDGTFSHKGHYNSPSDNSGWSARIDGTNEIRWFLEDNNEILVSTGINAVTLNQWNHVALTFDGTTAKIYVNGTEQASGTGSIGNNLSYTYQIGRRDHGTPSRYFDGQIDEVRIWNVARTATEIIGNLTNVIESAPGLVSYYDFNNSGNSTLVDKVASNNGTLIDFDFLGTSSDWVASTIPSCAPNGKFIGATNSDWNDPSNWCGGVVPTSSNVTEDVVVSIDSDIIENEDLVLNANDFQIAEGANLVLDLNSNALQLTNGATFTNNGTVFFETGTNVTDLAGSFINNGTIKGFFTFDNNFTNPIQGTVAPGASPGCATFAGDFTNSGTLEIEVDGVTACSEYDQISVGGTANLGGTLNVTLGYTPVNGDQIIIIDATTISGTFGVVNLPDPDWSIAYDSPSPGQVSLNYTNPTQAIGFDGPGGVGDTDGTSDLTLWFKADAGVFSDAGITPITDAGAMEQWNDQSGYGTNAFEDNPGAKATWNNSLTNGQPGLTFDGGDFTSFSDANLSAGSNPRTLIAVTSRTSDGERYFFSYGASVGGQRYSVGGSAAGSSYGIENNGSGATNSGAVTTVNTPSIVSVVYSGGALSTLQLYDNGTNYAVTGGTTPLTALNQGRIGSLSGGGLNWQGDIYEVINFNAPLNDASRTIIENYLSAKYNIAISNDLYAGDTAPNGDFDFDVAGIGNTASGSDPTANSESLSLTNGGFLQDDGDYIFAGHDGTAHAHVQTDLPGGGYTNRWARDWYIDIADAGANNGLITLTFDYALAGLTLPSANFALITRPTGSGAYTVAATNAVVSGSKVSFDIDVASLIDGHRYTIADDNSPNYALDFDATDQYVDMGIGLRDNLVGLSTITTEAWVYRTADQTFMTVVGNYVSGGMQFLLRMDGNKIAFFVDSDIAGFTAATGLTDVPLNTWTHIAGSWDGNDIRVYINGVEDGVASYPGGTLSNEGLNVTIGGNPGAPGGEFMQGQIDEVRIWNVARTEAQINTFKDVEIDGANPGLVAYYDFAEGPASILLVDKDSALPNYDGSLTSMDENTDWVEATHGVGIAGPLDTTNPTVTISSSEPDPTMASPFQITMLFSEEVTGFDLSDISVFNGSPSNLNTVDNIAFTADITPDGSGLITVDIFGGFLTDLTGNPNDPATQFSINYDVSPPIIVATSLAAGRNLIYVEFDEPIFGAADGSTPVDVSDFDITVAGGTATITKNSLTVLSPNEVEFDITINGVPDGAELVDVVPFATSVYDAGGNVMSVVQNSNRVTLLDQSVLSFDGVDDYIRVTTDAAFEVQQYTLEAWVNFPDAAPLGDTLFTIISKGSISGDGGIVQNGYNMTYGNNGGTIGLLLGHQSSGGTEFFQHPVTLSANTWYHLAGTYDGATMRLYIDGAEVAMHTPGAADVIHAGTQSDLKIGAFEGNSIGDTHRGLMDEVRIWNYARSAAQLSGLNDEEISGTQVGLVAYYDFNQAAGSTLTDIVAARNGTLENMDLAGASGNWASGGTALSPIDATAPNITLAQDLQTIGSTLIGGTVDDNFAVIEVSLDGGTTRTLAINNGDGSWNYNMGLDPNFGGDAPYTLNIYAIDDAENEGSVVGNLTVDLQNLLSFDGIDDYAEAPDAASLDITGALTLETWVFFNTAIDEETPLITKWNPDAAPEQRSYLLQVGNTSQVAFAVSTDGTTAAEGTNFSAVQVPYTFQVGRWYHVAATYEPSTFVRLYVNGELIGENVVNVMPSIFNSNASLVLGANGNTVEVGVGSVNTGEAMEMDEVRIWSEAKTQADIQASITTELIGSELNLAAYYDFNLAAGTTITDRTTNANDATLNDNNNGVADGMLAGPYWNASTVFASDILAPFFEIGYPLIDNITENAFDITVQLNEEGQYFYVVVPDGATTPSVDDVRAGTGFGGTGQIDAGNILVTTPATNFMLNATGLSPSTNYDLYIVAQDDEGAPNVQAIANLYNVTTLAGPAPGAVSANLSLWLKADQGVTGTTQVSQWDDLAGGLRHATQPTAANQPALTENAINYNPVISFDGSDDFFTSGLDITPATTPDLTTIIVFNSNTAAVSPFRKLFGHDAGSFQRSVGLDSRSATNIGYFSGSGVEDYFNISASQNYLSTTEYTSSTFSGYMDGFQLVNGAAVTNTGGNATLSIGAINLAGSEQWDGQIAEMIMYSGTLTGAERQRIETYLAIKYGISIDQTTATNYFASDGNPVWDGTAYATYNQHIAGIGRDDASQLDQKQSMSVDGRLSIALGTFASSNQANANSFANDLAYLVWGDNGLDMAFGARDIVNVPAGIDSRTQRVWRVSEANSDVGNVTLRFDLNGEGHPVTYNPGNFTLMLDTDADFSTGAIELPAASYAGGIVQFDNVNIANGQFISLGINEPPLPPTDFVVYKSSPTEITFEWTDNAFNETGYQILEADDYGFLSGIGTVANIAANSTSYTHTPSLNKFYLVVPTNGFEDPSSQSSIEFATTDAFPGQALDFDGTGQYVSVADNDALSFGDGATDSPMSVEAWIFLDQITSRSIVSKRSGENEWHLVISSDGRVSVTLADQSASGFLFGESPVVGFNTGEWYHVAFTYDGSSTAAGINTYVNGVLQAQNPGTSGPYTAMENTNSPVEIGSLNSGTSFNFDGQIDELKIWDFVKVDYTDRNASLDLSNAGYPAGLVAYYPLDEGAGSNTVDRSRNTNDGVFVGGPTFVPSTVPVPVPGEVSNTSDSGAGSLRDAITYANANPGTTITFNISGGGPYNIDLATALPDITAAGTIIDGTTQPGWTFGDVNNMVTLDGSLLGTNVSGLVINDVPNCEIYGLIVTGFTSITESVASIEINGDNADNAIIGAANMGNILHGMVSAGISFQDADFLTIQGNRFGTLDGTTRSEINKHVIYGAGTTDNLVIGGISGIGEGNLISGAGNGRFGLRLNVQGAIFIKGNYIGTNSNGDASIFNEGGGIYLSGANSGEIGGISAGEENVISGNTTGYGIRLGGSASIINNIIGLDRTGTNPVSNGNAGIILDGTGGVTIDGNIISSNGAEAITSNTGFGSANIINNIIGFDQSLTIARPNAAGIVIDNGPGTDNRFGYKDNPNIIANNTGAAIYLTNTSTGNTFATNQIYNNGSGIDLEAGANGSIAAPTIDNVTASDASGTGVDGTTIHLYLGDGSGQGQTFLDSTTVSGGIWSIPGLSLITSDQVVATATDYGPGIGTSEFSPAASIPVQNALAFDGTDDHGTIATNVFGGPYTGPFTIEAWVNSSLSGNNGTGVGSYGSGIFKNMENGSGAIGDLALTINNVGQIGLLNWREAAVDADGHTLSDASIPANTWTHVAASWDGSVNRIFINGVEQSFTQNGTSTSWASGFEIGRVHTSTQFHYDGTMDELRVWNVARSAVDITNNLYNELDPGTEVNLVAYYQFNQSAGTIIPDAKAANDATWDGTGGTNTAPAWGASTALTDPASVVTNTNDTGAGSLRDAITFANANPGTTVTFDIQSVAPWVIGLTSALPQITAANTVIDGVSQPGWIFGDPNAMVQIDGSGIGGNANGINIDAADVEVNGLILTGFAGNISNGAIYVASDAADNVIIGGANKGNIIHGTTGGNAIYIVNGDNATIQGNRIGTLDGTTLSAIGDHGIATTGEVTTLAVGGDFFTGEGNTISGSGASRYGMNLFGSGGTGLSNVTISGNKIGTNETGDGALPNGLGGINILGTNSAFTIGGSSPSNLNIISGNGDHGIIIQVGNGFDIDGNYIGLQSDGSSALGNGGSGIRINGTATNINIGVNSPNLISENMEYGIVYDGNSSSNTALGTNVFSCNQLGGIGYGSGPLTPGATIDDISLTTATVSTAAADGSTVFMYLAEDGCNNDQGVGLVGSALVAGGQAIITSGYAPYSNYVALVEDVNGFSEFSPAVQANFVEVTNTNDTGSGSFRAAIDSANTYPGTTIYFNLPGSGPWEITLASALPNITGAGTIIDATTQPFWDISTANIPNIIGNPGINIGLNFTSVNNVEVYGIRLSEFNLDGIRFNVVGSAADGYRFGAVGKGNIFTGNQNGIQVLTYSGGGTIQGNYFGILPDGTTATVSNSTGILLGTNADNVQIGGLLAGEGNVISNNTADGIRIASADMVTIQGNNIGLNPLETAAFGGTNGIDLTTATGVTVEQNVISGHGTGIRVNNSSGNTIIRNNIGVASDGTTEFGNNDGISIIDNLDSDNNIIGSSSVTSDGNIIANNTNAGILIDGAGNNGNQIRRNTFRGNLSGGISFLGGAQNGITPPSIDVIATANTVTGTGTNGDEIDLYLTDGAGQGEIYLESATVAGGVWSIGSLSLNGGDEVIATATNAVDGTSEFSTESTYVIAPYPELEGAGEALSFNGTTDEVVINSPSYAFGSTFTIETWIKTTDTEFNVFTLSDELTNELYFGYDPTSGGQLFYYASNDAGTTIDDVTVNTTSIIDGEWHHIAVVKDVANVSIYIDGVNQTLSTNNVNLSAIFLSGNWYLGSENQSLFLNGELDETRIWDFAMPESSLREYLTRKVTNAHPSFSNLQAYYRMDDSGDLANLRDFTPNVTDGAITGATYAQSGAHLGDASIYEYTYTAGSGRGIGNFQVDNLGVANLPLHIYQINQTPANNVVSGFDNIDRPEYYGVFAPGQTYNVTDSVFGLTSDRRILYRADGADPTWTSISGPIGIKLDDNRIYAYGQSGSGQFTSAIDQNPYPTPPDAGYAMSFDAVDDFVDLGTSSDYTGHQNLTLEAWVNPDYTNVSDHGAVISNLVGAAAGGGYQLSISNANVRVLYRDNTATDRELISSPLPEGEWSHLAGVIENAGATTNLYLYVNGEQVASSLGETGTPDYTGVSNLFIGSNSDGAAGTTSFDREFGGQLDEVRIWNVALTETNIRDNMIEKLDGNSDNLEHLVAYTRFDENSAVSVENLTGDNIGTVTGALPLVSGAPQGEGSLYSYAATPGVLNTAQFGEDINIHFEDATGGIHGYLVAGNPNQLQANGFNDLDQGKYYGVFAPGGQKVTLRMDYNNGGSYDADRRIVYRTDASDNAAVGGWERLSGLINSDVSNDSIFAYNVPQGEVSTALLNPPSSYPILGDTDPGSALSFDGFDDHVLAPSLETAFDASAGFTLEAWITPSNLNGTLQHLLGINNSYRLLVDTNDQLLLGTTDGATPSNVTNVAAALTNSTPVHIAATLTAAGNAELFIDGVSVHTQGGVSLPQVPLSSFYIGGLDIGENFFGEIDEVRVWSTVVNSADILNYANTTDIASHPNYEEMIAYFKFDEGTGSILQDVFANNDGTWNGPSGANITPNWVPSGALADAPEQNALNFDGDDYIDFVRQNLPSGLTYEAWINTTSTANTTAYNGNPALTVIGDNDNAIEGAFGVHDGKVRYTHWTGSGVIFDQIDGTIDVNDGEWHHIAVTHKSGSREVNIYVDGILDVTATSSQYSTGISANRVGSSYLMGGGNDNFFVGDIDEVRIWNVALPEEEIRNFLYEDDLSASTNLINLVLHYNFNQGEAGGVNSGETAAFANSGGSLDGVLNGFALSGPTSNFVSSGTTSFAPSAPSLQASNVSPTNVMEFTADVSWTSGDGDRRVVLVREGTGNPFPSPPDGTFGEAGDYGLGTDLDGGWFVVYNGYGNSTSIANLSGGTDYEVAVLEVNGPPNFEAYNTSPAVNNSVSFTTSAPISNFALDFDGMNDHAQVTSPLGFPVGGAPRTLEFWFKSNVDISSDTDHGIVQYGTNVTGQMFGLITTSNAPGKLYFFGFTNDVAGVTDIIQDQWYHAAVTYDGTDINLYLDGNLEASSTVALNTIMDANGFTIGRRPIQEDFWNGQLDEVRIWDYARSETEIQNDMNNELFGNEPGLVAYYPISDGTGSTTVTDITSGNDAPLVNMDENTDWVEGPSLAPPNPGSTFFEDFEDETLPAVASSGPFILGTGIWDGEGVLESGDIDARGGTGNGGRIEPAGGNYIQTPPLDQATSFGFWYKGESSGGVYEVFASTDGGTTWDTSLGTINPDPTYQEFTVDFTSFFDPSYTGAVRIEYISGANPLFIDDASADVDIVRPDVTITTLPLSDANINQGDTDVMIYKVQADVSGGAAALEGLYLTIAGADSLDFQLNGFDFYQNIGSDNFGTATLMGTGSWSPGNPIPRNSIGQLYPDIYPDGTSIFYYVTADISPTANAVTFNIELPVIDQFGFGNSNKLDGGLTAGNNFTIMAGADVTAPTVLSLTASSNPISDTDTQFELMVEFDENMDTGVDPTIIFPTEDPSATLTFNSGVWDDPLNYRATYDVTDVNVNLSDIDVDIIGSQDVAGNAMNIYNGPDAFSIDTENPAVTVDTYGTSITSPQLTGTVDDASALISVDVNGSNYPVTNNGDGTWTLAAGQITSLVDGTYDVVATAVDAAGNIGTDATVDELVISQTVLTLAAENVTSTSFTARWSEGLDVQTYQVDVSDVADFSTFLTGFQGLQTTETNVEVTGLDFSTQYFYRVRLVNTSSEVSSNSNTTAVKTIIDPETIADSTALVQIFDAINPQGLNWETARLSTWTGVDLDAATRTRVNIVDISTSSAAGDMPSAFTGDAVGGLSNMTDMNISDNQITGLMDFAGTAITNLNVSGNSLEFDDLEPVAGITTVDYSNQASVEFNESTGGRIEVRYTNDYSLSVTIGGSSNVYTWYRNETPISTGDDFIVNNATSIILAIDYDNMGTFRAEVTNTLLPGLTIDVDPQDVLAIADMQVTVSDSNGDPLTAPLDGFMLETTPIATGFPVLETVENVNASTFTFPDVVLGDYIIFIESDLELYIPTYFGNVFEWTEADTLFFRSDDVIEMTMVEVPAPLLPGGGDGTLDVLIEEDFGDDGARVEARRRASKRKCGLRRKRSGGRTGQDDEFELIAYGETDDNGEFQFGFLPQGIYRFFVEYPGIPLDESSFVEFEVGEAGVSDTDFRLQAFATEDGIEVNIEAVLGVILEYFKDLEIYPNPASEYLNIRYRHLKSGDVTAQLVDLSGNTKWSQDLRNGFDGQLRIDVTDYEEGIYILRFYDRENPQDNVVSFRVIVRD